MVRKRKPINISRNRRHKRNRSAAAKARRQRSFLFIAAAVFMLAGAAACFLIQKQFFPKTGSDGIAAAQPASASGNGEPADGTAASGNSEPADSPAASGNGEPADGTAAIKSSGALAELFDSEYKYPADLTNALKRNPEMLDFAEGYLTADGKAAGGISAAESREKCPLFLQWDKRWGYVSYGQSNIGISGCGPTCLSMVLYSLTRDKSLTPDALGGEAMNGGYYVAGAGTAWSFMKEVARRYGVFVLQNTIWAQNVMEFYLDDGKLLICAMGPGDFTDTGHFIVIRGHSGGKFLINDPFSRANSSREWDYDTIASQCRQIWAFELIRE